MAEVIMFAAVWSSIASRVTPNEICLGLTAVVMETGVVSMEMEVVPMETSSTRAVISERSPSIVLRSVVFSARPRAVALSRCSSQR